MVDRLVNSEANSRRINLVENCFGTAGQPLSVKGRVLVGEGVLTKACRKRPKARQFFLFNDLLVYGNILINKKKYNKQHIIPLEDVKLQSLEDDGAYKNGWLICTQGKSFAVYAATATEKQEWMAHIDKCIRDLISKSGKQPAKTHAAVWVPDDEAVTCMLCKKTKFNVIERRHHCRKCGAVVCANCSTKKFLLPNQSKKSLRVCDGCYEVLSKTANVPNTVDQKTTAAGNPPPCSPMKPPSRSETVNTTTTSNSSEKLISQDKPNACLNEAAIEATALEDKEFVEFNNKPLSMIREESEDTTPTTPPTTPITTYPKPLPLLPLQHEHDEIHPPVEKMFSVDIVDPELLEKTLGEMPRAPSEEPEIQIKPRNPQLYQLCQMNSNSSFWWDNSTDSNDEFGLNFRSDGVPTISESLSPSHPQLTASESITSCSYVENEQKGNDSSGSDDESDDDDQLEHTGAEVADDRKPNFYSEKSHDCTT